MKTANIKLEAIFACKPQEIYEAWMDSKKHAEMISGSAKIDPKVGGKFSIWDGSITGETLELDPENFRIIQNWRYDNWPKDHFSKVAIEFLPHGANETKVNFFQADVPEEFVIDIQKGWEDYYWKPMKEYFQRNTS